MTLVYTINPVIYADIIIYIYIYIPKAKPLSRLGEDH